MARLRLPVEVFAKASSIILEVVRFGAALLEESHSTKLEFASEQDMHAPPRITSLANGTRS